MLVLASYGPAPVHDDLLFITQLFTGTECLMRLGELTWPDQLSLQDYRKVSMRHSVELLANAVSFWLPRHKSDQYFEGNRLYIHESSSEPYRLSLQIVPRVTHSSEPGPSCGCAQTAPYLPAPGSSIAYVSFFQLLSLVNRCELGSNCSS